MYLFVLGRQPEIGVAELTAVFGDKVQNCGSFALYQPNDVDIEPIFKNLGSIVKIAKVIGDSWDDMPGSLPSSGKVTIGLSTYGTRLSSRDLNRYGMKVKKQRGSVRLVSSSDLVLSSATVFHNKLDKGGNKFEFILASSGQKQILARTIFVQNINDYTVRDRSRPRRDARVGMLPPKLAQTMINLAVGDDRNAKSVILDPFCGTGVVLQEAMLMGFSVYGTDIEPRMIEFTKTNLKWAVERYHLDTQYQVKTGDATSYKWESQIDFIASEAYLGQPYATEPSMEKLRENMTTCNTIIEKFLVNTALQIKPGTRLCLAVPAWFVGNRTYTLPVIEKLGKLGFDDISTKLIYHREDQVVGRNLLVLKK